MAMSIALIDSCGRSPEVISNATLAAPTPQKEKKVVMEKEVLANLLEKTNKSIADFVRDPATKLDGYGPKFGKGSKYKISKFAPTRRMIQYVGVVSETEAFVLTGDKDEFAKFVERSGVSLTRSEDRIGFGMEFLTICVAGASRLQILDSVSSIKPRPGLNEAQSTQFQAFVGKYTSIIKAPTCVGEACTYYAVSGQDLAVYELTISTEGTIKFEKKVLEKDLLIPYAM